MRKKAGQIILIIILIMATALGVGLAVVQRSLTDIQTSTKVEESQRAFSVAEAGIERALRTEGNESFGVGTASVDVTSSPLLPDVAGQALEYPPISKEEIAQFWLCNPSNLSVDCYGNNNNNNLYLYYGTSSSDKPAIEATIIYDNGTNYSSKKYFFDADSTRVNTNGFTSGNCPGGQTTGVSGGATFLCKDTIPFFSGMKILRTRLLYNNTSQSIALKPINNTLSLPKQAHIFTSTGTAGDTQRKVQVFKLDKVAPFYFDYALFSVGSINK